MWFQGALLAEEGSTELVAPRRPSWERTERKPASAMATRKSSIFGNVNPALTVPETHVGEEPNGVVVPVDPSLPLAWSMPSQVPG